jgi:hypothetical protein
LERFLFLLSELAKSLEGNRSAVVKEQTGLVVLESVKEKLCSVTRYEFDMIFPTPECLQ